MKRAAGAARPPALVLALALATASLLALPSSCHKNGDATQAAIDWIAAAQDADGLWHSRTYAMLRHGESTTAALALALAHLPDPHRAAAEPLLLRALVGLGARRAPSPPVPPEPVDYPCFTAAHRLHALALRRPEGWRATADELVAFLRQHQLGVRNGWPADAPESGGFGLGAVEPRHPLGGDMVGLAAVAAVLQALVAADVPRDDELFVQARTFVLRCQCGDGGFRYAPVHDWRGTKAGFARDANGSESPRSHGTATCDGILALLALGERPDQPELARALAWLEHNASATVPGLQHTTDPTLEPSMRLYWAAALASVARALPAHPQATTWRTFAASMAREQQQPDGSFLGLATTMKEDDPLVATALALLAASALD